jgi:GDP-L-fucose synthase
VKGQNILVAGGVGLMGMCLTRRLISLGMSVKSTFFLRKPPEQLKEYFFQYDFTRFEDCLAATKGQDYVIISVALSSGVSGTQQSSTSAILPNLNIYAGLLEACAQNKVKKTVWISSSTVYQEAPYPIREDQLDLNKQPYKQYLGIGWVYRYLEQLSQTYYQKFGLQIGIIRTANIYGPYDRFDDQRSHVIPALIKRALRKEEPFVVWGDGHTVRDFVYVDDLAEGILRVLNEHCIADPINISYGTPVSIKELVKAVLDTCDHHVAPQFDPAKPTAVPYRVLDNTKAETLLGRIEKTPLEKGIRKTVEWYTSDFSRD